MTPWITITLMAFCGTAFAQQTRMTPPATAPTSGPTSGPAPAAVADEAAFFGMLDLDRPELAAVRTAADARDWPAAKIAWAAHLDARTTPRWLFTRADLPRIRQMYAERGDGFAKAIAGADKALRREFSWQTTPKTLDRDIAWYQGDNEWTHQLNRHDYLTRMGQAYLATGDAKYADDAAYILNDWVRDNPVPAAYRNKHGNTWRTLEAGIRALEWMNLITLLGNAPAFDADTKYAWTRSMVEHARFLDGYTQKVNLGNWQVVECSGLFAIGAMLPEFKESPAWRAKAVKYLELQMEKGVEADGAQFELTPGYHGWVWREYTMMHRLAELNGLAWPASCVERQRKMPDFPMTLARGDRSIAPIGDAFAAPLDANFGIAGALYGRGDYRWLGPDQPELDWVWAYGPEIIEQFDATAPAEPAARTQLMRDAQYVTFRDGWGPASHHLLFDAAPWRGGHSHGDTLQLLLWANGRDLLFDPGICAYDLPQSGRLRKADQHTTLLVDGEGQTKDVRPVLATFGDQQGVGFASATIAFAGVEQTRAVLSVPGEYFVAVDFVSAKGGDGTRELTRQWRFGELPVERSDGRAWTAATDGTNLHLIAADADETRLVPRMRYKASDKDGTWPAANFVNRATLPATLVTLGVTVTTPADAREIEVLERTADLVTFRVTRADDKAGDADEVTIRRDGATACDVRRGGKSLAFPRGVQTTK